MNSIACIGRAAPSISVVALLACATISSAAVTGHRWEVIDNSTYNFGSLAGQPTGLTNVYTFDLFLQDDGGVPVSAIDSNDLASVIQNDGISVSGGTFYQVDFLGANNLPPSQSEIDFAPALEFDSYVGLGPFEDSEILVASAVDFGVAGGTRLRGVWAPNPGAGVGSTVPADENSEIFVGRFSVELSPGEDITTAFLGGELSAVLADGTRQVLTIDNAFDVIPSPGSAALFGLAGLAAARRRR
jgi:hypothetical protein